MTQLSKRAVYLLLLTPIATLSVAFDSYPTGPGIDSVHDKIVNVATEALGIDDELDELQEAVRRPDFEETSLTPGDDFLQPNSHYRADHHFDRPPNKSHAEAFGAGAAYFQMQLQRAVERSQDDEPDAAVDSIGRALHAIQDFVSHSNLIDLSEADANQAIDAIFDDAGATPPSGLKLTGFDPAADPPGKPANDTYGHDDFCKDKEGKNSESQIVVGGVTKYALAYDRACKLTSRTLESFRGKVSDSQWDEFLDEAD